MNDKASINLTGKDAAKLLEGLTKDPKLRSEDDPSILAEEQFPTDHHALLQGKTDGSSTDNIITILLWERHHTPHLSEEQKAMLTEQKTKTAKLFQFTATTNNPRMEHLGRNKNPIRKLGQNVREKTRKIIF
jgi:hypothetical protein